MGDAAHLPPRGPWRLPAGTPVIVLLAAANRDPEVFARPAEFDLDRPNPRDHIAEYADDTTERGRCLLKSICEEMGFDSLRYQSLDGLLEAIGLDRDKVCTYCWDGRE